MHFEKMSLKRKKSKLNILLPNRISVYSVPLEVWYGINYSIFYGVVLLLNW